MTAPNTRGLTDDEFAEKLMRGNRTPELLTEAFRRYFPLMLHSAAVILRGNIGLAEDVAQETFIRLLLLGSIARLRYPSKMRPFLETSARRAALDAIRVISRAVPSEPLTPETAVAIAEEEEAQLEDLRGRLVVLLPKLKPRHREIVQLRLLESRSISEIAARLSLTYAAAAQRLSRALLELKAKTK